ncbi:universal stress protein [Salipaludibacillus agaradhaerens]|jgi:nucleotide-binding universal stress UspA family protein|uniref:Universal stress protein n=1 Tax=Salipaludibacillus agaradhaerens TaxID=76935 RepID=A0A9Q4AZA7_SALAG|nr:universal stress protein [Salipaludibacillus agaradhaerens]MCR6095527.1 universal stress protein [Salipaludibacillus agaradhaerens]MCR6114913.1 universal stress protein [Salipaludibacillus agaradhaerens]
MSIKYDNILVAVDGSDEAKRAFRKALLLAKDHEAKLLLTHIVDTRTFASVEHYDRTIFSEAEKYARDMLEEYKKLAQNDGLNDVTLILDYGSPKVKIAKEVAKKYEVDLIVTGATGLNAVERFLIGSVSEHITRHAKCDVLIVRTDS